jgi:DNA-binding IclR family transcriptional regulator
MAVQVTAKDRVSDLLARSMRPQTVRQIAEFTNLPMALIRRILINDLQPYGMARETRRGYWIGWLV